MNISFIIVTYESGTVIESCLRLALSIPHSEVLVVDNGSTDETRAKSEALGAQIIAVGENSGFARAANLGASVAKGDLICFLNPDCDITAEVCDAAIIAMRNRTKACAVPNFKTGDIVVIGRQPGYTRLKLIVDMMEAGRWPRTLVSWLRRLPGHHDRTWNWPLGTCLFVPRHTFVKLGGFSTEYFMYMEDVEFGRTHFLAGGEVISLPHFLSHGGALGSRVSRAERKRILARGRLIYGRRHYGWPFMALMRIIGAF
jgi:N-acetylglucosaminyl-diphospho-decaprenol L-rhamnosyltransferase